MDWSLDLLAACFTGWEGEQASVNCWLEQTPQAELGGQLVEEWTGYKLRRKARPGWAGPVEWAVHWSPRGWIRQMQIAYTENLQEHIRLLDPQQQRVFPADSRPSANPTQCSAGTFTPGVALLRRVLALNFVRPEAASARNQTGINQARIACALERYRIAHGHFPEELRQLIPDYMERLPHDVANGRSLRYCRTEDGVFVLYSVGWDGQDGAAGSGDWVWRYPAQ